MWGFSGLLTADGTLVWDVHDGSRQNPEEGMSISVSLASYKTPLQALDEKNKRLAVERLREGIAAHKIPWLELHGQVWVLDLDLFSDYINRPDWKLFQKTWFTGKAYVEPEFGTNEHEGMDGVVYETFVHLTVLPGSLNSYPLFVDLVSDREMANILTLRWLESKRALKAEAYLSTIILLGSILEGVLLDLVQQHPQEASSAWMVLNPKKGSVPVFDKWPLQELIKVAHKCGWMGRHVGDFSSALREYRNLVHPARQQKENVYPSGRTCKVSFAVVEAALDDLSHHKKI